MISKILVPVDGSESSERALDYALDIAVKYEAELYILTVVEYANLPAEVIVAYMNATDKYHRETLSKAVEKAEKVLPHRITGKLVEGYPSDRIIDEAKKGGCDLIVMGRRGRGHLTHTLLGSVSDRVADSAPCPLLIIK